MRPLLLCIIALFTAFSASADWEPTTSPAQLKSIVLNRMYGGIHTREAWNKAFATELKKDDPVALAFLFKIAAREKFTIDLNQTEADGDMPLHRLARESRGAAFKLLLAHGADPNVYNAQGFTPLHLAVSKLNLAGVKSLCATGKIWPNHKKRGEFQNSETALAYAAVSRQGDMLKAVIQDCKASTAIDVLYKNRFVPFDLWLVTLDSLSLLEARWPKRENLVSALQLLSERSSQSRFSSPVLRELVIAQRRRTLGHLVRELHAEYNALRKKKEISAERTSRMRYIVGETAATLSAAISSSNESAFKTLITEVPNVFEFVEGAEKKQFFDDAIALSDVDFFKAFLSACPPYQTAEMARLSAFAQQVASPEKSALLKDYFSLDTCTRPGTKPQDQRRLSKVAQDALERISRGEDLPRNAEMEADGKWEDLRVVLRMPPYGNVPVPLLSVAVEYDNIKALRSLLRFGANPNQVLFGGLDVGDIALQRGNVDVVLALLDAGGFEGARIIDEKFRYEPIFKKFPLRVLQAFVGKGLLRYDPVYSQVPGYHPLALIFASGREDFLDWYLSDPVRLNEAKNLKVKDIPLLATLLAQGYRGSANEADAFAARARMIKKLDALGFNFFTQVTPLQSWDILAQTCLAEVTEYFRPRFARLVSGDHMSLIAEASCLRRPGRAADRFWYDYHSSARASIEKECRNDLTAVGLTYARDKKHLEALFADLSSRMADFWFQVFVMGRFSSASISRGITDALDKLRPFLETGNVPAQSAAEVARLVEQLRRSFLYWGTAPSHYRLISKKAFNSFFENSQNHLRGLLYTLHREGGVVGAVFAGKGLISECPSDELPNAAGRYRMNGHTRYYNSVNYSEVLSPPGKWNIRLLCSLAKASRDEKKPNLSEGRTLGFIFHLWVSTSAGKIDLLSAESMTNENEIAELLSKAGSNFELKLAGELPPLGLLSEGPWKSVVLEASAKEALTWVPLKPFARDSGKWRPFKEDRTEMDNTATEYFPWEYGAYVTKSSSLWGDDPKTLPPAIAQDVKQMKRIWDLGHKAMNLKAEQVLSGAGFNSVQAYGQRYWPSCFRSQSPARR